MSRFTQKPDYYTDSPVSENPIEPGGLLLPKKKNVYYMDVNRSYKYHDLKSMIVYDEDAVNRFIANILLTPLGTDSFEPTFGSNVPYRLMDSVSNITAHLLKSDSMAALTEWLVKPEVIVLYQQSSYVRMLQDEPEGEGYEIKIVYSIQKTKVLREFHQLLLK